MAEYIPGFQSNPIGQQDGKSGYGQMQYSTLQRDAYGGPKQFEQGTIPNRGNNLGTLDDRPTKFAASKNFAPEPENNRKTFIETVAEMFGCGSKE